MSAEEIVAALGGQWRGHHGTACCPAHDDKTPSLSIAEDDGRVLWHCFAGCAQDAVLAALRSRGLDPLSATEGASGRPSGDAKERDAERADEARRYLLHTKRVEAEADRARVANYLKARGLSGKLPRNACGRAGEKEMPFPLYLPAMVFAVQASDDGRAVGAHRTHLAHDGSERVERRMRGPVKGGIIRLGATEGDTLLIGEGVETVLSGCELTGLPGWSALAAENMNAIAVPAGYAEIVVLADNDAPGLKAGRALAERIARAGKVARLAVPPTEGADWNDEIRREGTDRAALAKAIRQAPVVEAPSGLVAVASGDLVTMSLPPRQMLLAPWLPRQGLAMLHAFRGIGKTHVALAMAHAIAAGSEVLGWRCEHSGDVLYLDGELPATILQDRCKGMLAHFGSSAPYPVRLVTPDLQEGPMPDLATEEGQLAVDRLVRDKTVLLVVDAVSTLVRSGEENAAESWSAVQGWALRHRAAGRSVLFVHHSGKTGKQRGTSRREDVLDTVITLTRPEGYSAEEGGVFRVEFEKARGFYGPEAAPFEVMMRTDADGRIEFERVAVRNTRLHEVADLLQAKVKQSEIAAKLNISEARVSQLKKQAAEAGLLDAGADAGGAEAPAAARLSG